MPEDKMINRASDVEKAEDDRWRSGDDTVRDAGEEKSDRNQGAPDGDQSREERGERGMGEDFEDTEGDETEENDEVDDPDV